MRELLMNKYMFTSGGLVTSLVPDFESFGLFMAKVSVADGAASVRLETKSHLTFFGQTEPLHLNISLTFARLPRFAS